MLRLVLPAIAALALAGCQIPEEDAPMPDTPELCAAEEYQHYIGQPLARLDISTLPEPYRIIAPGMAVTLDHRPERLNISHDAQGIIRRITCG